MKIETVTRKYVDLSLFTVVFDHINSSYTSGFKYDLGTDYITLYFSRYTMNPHGYHVGYEDYSATLELIETRDCENSPRAVHLQRRMLVDIESIDNLTCESAPETEPCVCESGDCDCDEEHECSDGCQCERYVSPIDEDDYANDEWAYEEFRHMIEMVTDYPARWEYNGESWVITTDNGDILHESDWTPGS